MLDVVKLPGESLLYFKMVPSETSTVDEAPADERFVPPLLIGTTLLYAVTMDVAPEPLMSPLRVIVWLPVRYVFVSTMSVPLAPLVFTKPFVPRLLSCEMLWEE